MKKINIEGLRLLCSACSKKEEVGVSEEVFARKIMLVCMICDPYSYDVM